MPRLSKVAAMAALAAVAPTALFAADGTVDQSDASGSGGKPVGVETVVVTAERREESSQRVPIALTVVTTDNLKASSINNTQYLQSATPGLVMAQQIVGASPYIRGVGAQAAGQGAEPSVSTYIDGVYIGPANASFLDFNNVDQVEVLRGPQGTLFGRNATGGLIQIITATPTPQSHVTRLSLSGDNYETVRADGYFARGLNDSTAVDLALHVVDQNEGWGKNLHLGTPVNYQKEIAGRTKFVYTPTDALTITATADYTYNNDDIGASRNVFPGQVDFGGTKFLGTIWDSNSDVPRRVALTQGGASLKVSYDFGSFTVSSLTALRRYTLKASFDQDGTPYTLVVAKFNHSDETAQEELLAQGSGSNFNWTAGFFYFMDASYAKMDITSAISAATNFRLNAATRKNSYAGFVQGTYEILPATNLTLGLRYTQEPETLKGNQTALPGNPLPAGTVLQVAPAGAKDRESKLTWRVGLDHRVTDDVMAYLFYARGFKTGGFNIYSVLQAPIKPEVLDDLEGGVKADLFDGLARVNVAAFDYMYRNLQLSTSNAGITQTLNAANAKLYGGEVEMDVVPPVGFGNLQLHGGLSLLHAVYGTFLNTPYYQPAPGACTPTPHSTGAPTGGNLLCVVNGSGNAMMDAPNWTANFAVDYSFPLGAGVLDLRADFSHTASFYWDPSDRLMQPSYDLVNAQIRYDAGNGLAFRIYGSNLTQAKYYTWGYSSTLGDTGVAAAPRVIGIGVDYDTN
jgi:iron complex outermembrane recepter protein